MIRAFIGTYLRFEDESNKRQDSLIIIEILNKKMDSIQLIVCNETHLLLACQIDSITEISGYHRYLPATKAFSPFGIGGLSKLRTDDKKGMLEGLAAQTHIDYNSLATNFGRGLLEIDNDYVMLID